MADDLHALLQRCRAGDATAWERFATWVKMRGRSVLGGVGNLSAADGEDTMGETLKALVAAIQRNEIRGTSNAEIDAYVCTAIRNRALNVLRGRARRREATPSRGTSVTDASGSTEEVPDDAPAQDAQAIATEQLGRAEKLLLSWPAEDRYLFIAKLNGVSARVIQQTLEKSPFRVSTGVTTIDTRFHRLRKRMMEHIREP